MSPFQATYDENVLHGWGASMPAYSLR